MPRWDHSSMSAYEDVLAEWNAREAVAEAAIPLIGRLHRDKGVTVVLHSRSLVNNDAIRIIKTHRFARRVSGDELSVRNTFPFLEAVSELDISSVKVDLARLHAAYEADDRGLSIPDFVAEALRVLTEQGGDRVIRISNADYLSRPLRLSTHEATALIVALRALRGGAITEEASEVVDRALAKLEQAAAGATVPETRR